MVLDLDRVSIRLDARRAIEDGVLFAGYGLTRVLGHFDGYRQRYFLVERLHLALVSVTSIVHLFDEACSIRICIDRVKLLSGRL